MTMSFDTRLWILRHPRLLYLAIIPAMVVGSSLGFAFAGFWGGLFCGSTSLMLALYGYAYFRIRLLRASGGEPPPEPPTEGSPRPSPLRPFSPLIQAAQAEIPNDRNA